METFLPENAPFTEEQRAWLNGFIAGLLGMERAMNAADKKPWLVAVAGPAE